ncbi:MAG: pyruvate kinase [Candidatus Gracilibacteria bacterium]|nr:pyruvate kinase [Candidatus Gracilibacteria bacterium]
MKKTKIIATVGPVTASKEKLQELYDAGVNIVRFNFSHVDYDFFSGVLQNIKELNESGTTNLSTLLDTKGPEIRTKKIDDKVEIIAGEEFYLSTINEENNIDLEGKKLLVCDYEYILTDMKVGDIVDIDSGLLKARVEKILPGKLLMTPLNSHLVGGKRHLNLPGVKLKLPGITESDKKDIEFGITKDFDFIAMSFVRSRANILELKEFLAKNNAPHIKIISKIENEEALENLDEIIDETHGIMVARGDLGIEIPIETIPVVQKMMVKKCKAAGKFVIVATQMLETMIDNPIPTRAEVTDIYNACMQKADCTMLSGETTIGKYPIETVAYMANILSFTEKSVNYDNHKIEADFGVDNNKRDLVTAAVSLATDIDAKAILVFTRRGFMARLASTMRPKKDIYAFCYDIKVLRFLNILFGVRPVMIEKKSNEENVETAIAKLKDKNIVSSGDKLVVVFDTEKNGELIPSIQIINC